MTRGPSPKVGEGAAQTPGGALRKTPLHAQHRELGGRMVPFAGWEMPLQYASVGAEHRAVREAAGVFDVSHMGEFEVRGGDAAAFLDHLVTNRPSGLGAGGALYTPMCRPDGGVIDDLLVYRFSGERFWMVVNAANAARDLSWVRERGEAFGGDVRIEDISDRIAQIALQGPRAEAILSRLTDADLAGLGPFTFLDGAPVAGASAVVSRTGYTGEDGFELYVPAERAVEVWRAILEAGRGDGILPAGLGARDSLRFEASLPLHGQELTEDVNALEAGLGPFVKWDKGDFVGREALLPVKETGRARRIAGIRLDERAVPRHGYPVTSDGREVGVVTSGMISPTLGVPLALALVETPFAEEGRPLSVRVRGRDIRGRVVKRPFYRRRRS